MRFLFGFVRTSTSPRQHRSRPATFESLEQRFALSVTFVDSGQELGDDRIGFISALSLGDVDQDGDLDAFVASDQSPNSILFNDGKGNFSVFERHLFELSSNDVKLGDVDGDGDLDAVVANHPRYPFGPRDPRFPTRGGDTVWLNDGTGSFEQVQSIGEKDNFDVELADMDGDGDIDIFVAGNESGVSLNDGLGRFSFIGLPKNVTNLLTESEIGDVDNDGDQDVVVRDGRNDELLLLRNAGDGVLFPSVLMSEDLRSIDLRDFDGDGDLDLFVTRSGPDGFAEVHFNQGDGQFVKGGQEVPSGSAGQYAGDINGDGTLDVVTLESGGQQFWLNDGNGAFTKGSKVENGPTGRAKVAFGDLDGDSDLDMLVGRRNVHTWLNDGSGVFERISVLGDTPGEAVALGDIDGDGDVDAMVSNATHSNEIWLNDGRGTFFLSDHDWKPTTDFSDTRSEVSVADLDGDGDLDAFASGRGTNVWLNDGDGRFVDSGQDFPINRLTLGDVDGDKDLDALVRDDELDFRVYLNHGDAVFSDTDQMIGTMTRSSPKSGTLADVDGDGDLDIVIGTSLLRNSEIWLNDGLGKFSFAHEAFGKGTIDKIALGDLDGDGDMDAFVATTALNLPNTVWLNDGKGQFADSGQELGGTANDGSFATDGVELVDVDGDSDLDAILANNSTFAVAANQIWINDGRGAFTLNYHSLGANATSLAVDDLDGDGDVDVFFTNLGKNHVWLNVGQDDATILPGDANRDRKFDNEDVAQIVLSGKYLSRLAVTWEEGDWNGDGLFNQLDIVAALQTGSYQK